MVFKLKFLLILAFFISIAKWNVRSVGHATFACQRQTKR